METKYFVALYDGQLFGLFKSNNERAINFQINELLKNPKLLVKEVGGEEYEKHVNRLQAMGNS